MSNEVRLTSPRLRIVPADGEPYEVQAENPDLVAWDRARGRYKWPGFQDAPFLWITFVGWAASRRTGRTDLSFEEFESSTRQVENLTDEDEDTSPDLVSPILPDPGSGF